MAKDRTKIEAVLRKFLIQGTPEIIEEYALGLFHRAGAKNEEEAVEILTDAIKRADRAGKPITRPRDAGPWLGIIGAEREERAEEVRRSEIKQINEETKHVPLEERFRDPKLIGYATDLLNQVESLESVVSQTQKEIDYHNEMRGYFAKEIIRNRVTTTSYLESRLKDLHRRKENADKALDKRINEPQTEGVIG